MWPLQVTIDATWSLWRLWLLLCAVVLIGLGALGVLRPRPAAAGDASA